MHQISPFECENFFKITGTRTSSPNPTPQLSQP